MVQRWTQAVMQDLAIEERRRIGLTPWQSLDPYRLAAEWGIRVAGLDDLSGMGCPGEAVEFFLTTGSSVWSAALVPIGSARLIVENTGHVLVRRRANVAHEMAHHLLEHDFDTVMLADDGHCNFDPKKEKEAKYLGGELLVPYAAAKKAAFDREDNAAIAARYNVSTQFAQQRMYGVREYARRALARQAGRA